MGFKKDVTNSVNNPDAMLAYNEFLSEFQMWVQTKKLKKSIFMTDNEEMVGKEVAVCILRDSEDKFNGLMITVKNKERIPDEKIEKLKTIQGVDKVEEDGYQVANDDDDGAHYQGYYQVMFDDAYPTTRYNAHRVAGLVDMVMY